MNRLPPPATGVEIFLAAILDELRALRADLAGGGQGRFLSTVPAADDTAGASTAGPAVSSAKRTRQRTRTPA